MGTRDFPDIYARGPRAWAYRIGGNFRGMKFSRISRVK